MADTLFGIPAVTRESEREGRWECGGVSGLIWRCGGGYVADSPALIINGRAAPSASMDDAARRAYRREVVLGPMLDGIRRKYVIEHPDTSALVAVYAVDANDPSAAFDGEPAEGGRYANLMPWEREAVRVARANARLAIMVKDENVVTLAAVAGRHVTLIRTENGAETGRWRVLDGCRKVALFLA